MLQLLFLETLQRNSNLQHKSNPLYSTTYEQVSLAAMKRPNKNGIKFLISEQDAREFHIFAQKV